MAAEAKVHSQGRALRILGTLLVTFGIYAVGLITGGWRRAFWVWRAVATSQRSSSGRRSLRILAISGCLWRACTNGPEAAAPQVLRRGTTSSACDLAREAQHRLSRYLAESSTTREACEPLLKQIVKGVVPASLRPGVRHAATSFVMVRERRRALNIGRIMPLQLHLGSGRSPKPGWVNVDLFGDPADLVWNLDRPLPFEENTVDAIFHEHLLEHFTLGNGLALTEECHRVLKPGGVLRIGVPDTAAYARAYVRGGGGRIASACPGRPTPLLALQEVFYRYGHRAMYDFDTLALVCNAAGFETVEHRQFGDSRLAPCPDSDHRRRDTLYVEAVK
jgi:SAM-dependent methyltransferase